MKTSTKGSLTFEPEILSQAPVTPVATSLLKFGERRFPFLTLLFLYHLPGILDQMVVLQERIGRGSLFHIMHEGGSYPHLSDILKIMTQIAEGLSFLHARGIVHSFVNSHR